MHVMVRSYLTAGVAFVGAGAIAITPVQPITPALQPVAAPAAVVVSSAPVELAALVNPIVLWAEALGETAGNVGSLATNVLQDPAPILEAFLRNQFAAGSTLVEVLVPFAKDLITGFAKVPQNTVTAVRNILRGDIFQGIGELATVLITPIAGAMFPLLFSGGLDKITAILQNPFENISRVIGRVVSAQTLIGVGLPLLTDLIAPILQVGATAQAVFDGLKARNLEAVINAIISFPSDLFNTVLNGSSNPMIGNGGLLGPNGLLAGLLGLRKGVADVIEPAPATPQHPPAPPALVAAGSFAGASAPPVGDVPDAGAYRVNVSLDAGPEGDRAAEGALVVGGVVDKVTDEGVKDEVVEDDVTPPADEEEAPAPAEEEDEARATLTESEDADDAAEGNDTAEGNGAGGNTAGEGNATDDGATNDGATDDGGGEENASNDNAGSE